MLNFLITFKMKNIGRPACFFPALITTIIICLHQKYHIVCGPCCHIDFKCAALIKWITESHPQSILMSQLPPPIENDWPHYLLYGIHPALLKDCRDVFFPGTLHFPKYFNLPVLYLSLKHKI